jgi:hypothetical protein
MPEGKKQNKKLPQTGSRESLGVSMIPKSKMGTMDRLVAPLHAAPDGAARRPLPFN